MNAKTAVELSIEFMHTFNEPGDSPSKIRKVAKAIRKAVNVEKMPADPPKLTENERKQFQDRIDLLNSEVMKLEQRNLALTTRNTLLAKLIISLKAQLRALTKLAA